MIGKDYNAQQLSQHVILWKIDQQQVHIVCADHTEVDH